jgi:hypothetical protein
MRLQVKQGTSKNKLRNPTMHKVRNIRRRVGGKSYVNPVEGVILGYGYILNEDAILRIVEGRYVARQNGKTDRVRVNNPVRKMYTFSIYSRF